LHPAHPTITPPISLLCAMSGEADFFSTTGSRCPPPRAPPRLRSRPRALAPRGCPRSRAPPWLRPRSRPARAAAARRGWRCDGGAVSNVMESLFHREFPEKRGLIAVPRNSSKTFRFLDRFSRIRIEDFYQMPEVEGFFDEP